MSQKTLSREEAMLLDAATVQTTIFGLDDADHRADELNTKHDTTRFVVIEAAWMHGDSGVYKVALMAKYASQPEVKPTMPKGFIVVTLAGKGRPMLVNVTHVSEVREASDTIRGMYENTEAFMPSTVLGIDGSRVDVVETVSAVTRLIIDTLA